MSQFFCLRELLPIRPTLCSGTLRLVRLAAGCSQRAYGIDIGAPWGCEVHDISVEDAEATVFLDEEFAVVAFRGSEFTWRDWFRNFLARPVRFPYGTVHQGFLQAFSLLDGPIESLLRKHLSEGLPIIATGHSQGGSNATLFADKYSDYPNTHLITFGSPRVGDAKFAQFMNAALHGRHLRIMHSNDIVPRVPHFFLSSRPQRFKHCGLPILLKEDGSWLVNPSTLRSSQARLADFKLDMLRDHQMSAYRQSLSRSWQWV